MYYPFLRGRQNELLALQTLLEKGVLSSSVIPIIEPVKLSPTLLNTIEKFRAHKRELVIIQNPIVGSYETDKKNPRNEKYAEKEKTLFEKKDQYIRRAIYINEQTSMIINEYQEKGYNIDNIFAICLETDMLKFFKESLTNTKCKIVVPYERAFRRISNFKILIEDRFLKKQRNAEYKKNDDEFFSDDHLYYVEEKYNGFSDYSIVGKEYIESGFAPYAVAIHIVYFNDEKELRIHHFVSDDDEDYNDPAGKFYQALKKLHDWHKNQDVDTIALREFEKIYETQSYPGLGVIKRLSIMHHLELMSQFLDGEQP